MNGLRLFRTACGLALGVLLVACAVEPTEPALVMAAPTGAASIFESSVEPLPVPTTRHRMSTDVAGPVDLGSEPTLVDYGERNPPKSKPPLTR
jgi:hypothetical protein